VRMRSYWEIKRVYILGSVVTPNSIRSLLTGSFNVVHCVGVASAIIQWLGLNIIHIWTRHVSFSILIGRNSVAEWLIVASSYHLNSDPK
jgi:hypothetical protein